MAALPEPSLRLLAAMAVAGEPLPLPVAGSVAAVLDPSGALDHLVDAGFVEWPVAQPGDPIGLRDRPLREAVYHNLAGALRERTHRSMSAHTSGIAGWAHRVAGSGRHDGTLAADLAAEARRYHAAGDP